MGDKVSTSQLKITEINIPDLVKLLKRAGSRFASEDAVRKDIELGAPVNHDGTINLIHYTSWLVREEIKRNAN